jgi:hypothetical protein
MVNRTFAVFWLLPAALALGADSKGVRPRIDRTQYAVAMFNESLAVAAELVPAEKIRKQFGPEVDSRYLVVEVAVYPIERSPLDVRPEDFTLRLNRTRDAVSPTGAKEMADGSESAPPVALEISGKCLRETSTYKPVAGYLYFPIRDKDDEASTYELEYKSQETWMILPLRDGSPK